MINNVVLVGRLTKEPQLRKTPSGASVCSFTLAVSRRKSRNDNGNTPDADFIPCTAWNQTADVICQYLHKGSQIGVTGRITTRNYDDPNTPGRKVYVTEVLVENMSFLESKSASQSRPANNSYYPDDNYNDMAAPSTFDISADDDLPF